MELDQRLFLHTTITHGMALSPLPEVSSRRLIASAFNGWMENNKMDGWETTRWI